MSSLFGNLTTEGLEESQDRLPGFQPLPSDIYTGKVKLAYAGESKSGAQSITLVMDFSGKEYRQTIYITDKSKKNYFLNKDDQTKKVPLPGFTVIDDLCLIAVGKPLAEMSVEEKVVKVYDYELNKEINKSVPMLVELLSQEVSMAIVLQQENKNKKDDNGEYQVTAETREVNDIAKVFKTDRKMTVPEARAGQDTGTFWDSWLERNKGKVIDRRKVKDGKAGVAGAPSTASGSGAPQAGASAPAARPSLFGKK